MLTPEQIAEYQTERKAIAMLKAGYGPMWDRECYGCVVWLSGTPARRVTGETPILALAAAHDALGMKVEECPVVAAYKEALVEEIAVAAHASHMIDRLRDGWSPDPWSELDEEIRERYRSGARAVLSMKEE